MNATVEFPQEGFLAHVVEWVRKGGDPRAYRTKTGWSLLHIAAEFGDAKAIGYLAGLGVDPDVQDENGWTALHLAVDAEFDCEAQTGRPTELLAVRALVGSGANPSAQATSGETPRDIAAARGKDALSRYDAILA